MMESRVVLSNDEKRWRAEEDARIIANYLELMKDKERVKLASEVAKKQVEDLEKRLNAMKQVAKRGGKK